MNPELKSIPTTMIQISKDAVRKLMRHGWNVYPLEAFGFLLGRTRGQAFVGRL